METIKLIILCFLTAIILSCQKDEFFEPIEPISQPIPKIRTETDGTYFATYTYDDQGRIVEENYEEGWKTIYKYESNKVIRETYNIDGTFFDSDTYQLNDKGICTSFIDGQYGRTYYFQYDADGRKTHGYSTSADGTPFQEYFYFYENGNVVKDSTVYASDSSSIVVAYEYFTDVKTTIGNYNRGIFYLGKGNENPVKRITRDFKGINVDVYNYSIPIMNAEDHIMQTSYSINNGTLYTYEYTYY